MSEQDAIALKPFLWRGRQVKIGDTIPGVELAEISGTVLRALLVTGQISRDPLALAAPDERVAALEKRIADLTAEVAALRGEKVAA